MTDPREIAEEQSKPGKFSLIDRLQNRGLPSEDVDIYLDEKLGWDLIRLEEKHNSAKKDSEVREIEAKIKRVRRELQDSRYVFRVQGMTSERYDELIEKAYTSHPKEEAEQLNPLTGEKTMVEVPSEERDKLLNHLILEESIVSVTDPDGNVDDNITLETVAFLAKLGPLDGLRRISELAFRMRMAVEWMDVLQDEDF